jgi:exopolysaccharide biosynthesis polyprenyl glycosylphosphotransferase
MKSVQIRNVHSALLVGSDALCSIVSFFIGYYLRVTIPFPRPAEYILSVQSYFFMIVIQVFFIVVLFFLYRLYHQPRTHSIFDEVYAIFGAVSISLVLLIAATTVTLKNTDVNLNFSRGILTYEWVSSIILITSARTVVHWFFQKIRIAGFGRDRVLIIGVGEVARMIIQKIQSLPSLAYEIAGAVARNAADSLQAKEVSGVPLLGIAEDLPRLIPEHKIDEVIVAIPDVNHAETVAIIGLCDRSAIKIRIFPDTFMFIAGRISIEDLGGLPLLSLRDVAMRGWRLAVKRMLDIGVSLCGLVVLSPVMLLIAILIKLESRGPVLYKQERMGLDAKPFHMLKFRSMREDAEAKGPGWTMRDDPRRTRVGAVIRRFNLDELPQLINVLLGQMSLVGPRAERPYYVEQFMQNIPGYMGRHKEKAGLTGWAQVNGLRGDTSIKERTKYDLWYIENWSLFLDFKIISRQLYRLFNSRNAY